MNERAGEILEKGASELGVSLTPVELGKFHELAAELKRWGRKINLTAIRGDEEIAIKHFLDSLTLLGVVGARGSLLDVGSGAGFPAIPVQLMRPELQVVSVDAVEKKIIFQRHMARRLGLLSFTALHARVEELAVRYAGCFDWVVSRAFSDITFFVRIALPLLKVNGSIIAMKGRGGGDEAALAGPSLHDMGVEIIKISELRLPITGDVRTLVTMKRA